MPARSAVSSPTAAVQSRSEPPSNKQAPTIAGVAQVGEVLRADPGIWSPDPKQLAYMWLRCDADGKDCVEIRDATSEAYVPRAVDELLSPGADGGGDVGATLRVAVTAVNDGGKVTAHSDPTASVVAAKEPPKDDPPPTGDRPGPPRPRPPSPGDRPPTKGDPPPPEGLPEA